jgi:hypothetical protein
MNQALYAHMNNKRKRKGKKIKLRIETLQTRGILLMIRMAHILLALASNLGIF